jgi:hypothetical protein
MVSPALSPRFRRDPLHQQLRVSAKSGRDVDLIKQSVPKEVLHVDVRLPSFVLFLTPELRLYNIWLWHISIRAFWTGS